MKKTLVSLVILLLVLGACSKSEPEKVPEPVVPTEVKKIDETKPYVYSDYAEASIDLNDLKDEIGWANKENMHASDFPKLVEKAQDSGTENIVINIDSNDASTLQKELDNYTQSSLEANAKVKQDPSKGGVWKSIVLYDTVETSTSISLMILDFDFIFNSDAGSAHMSAYVFDKETGKLLSTDEVLALAGFTMGTLTSEIEAKAEAFNAMQEAEGNSDREQFKPEYFADDFNYEADLDLQALENQTSFLRLKPEKSLFINADGSLVVIYQTRSFFGLNDNICDKILVETIKKQN